ncbi:MAG: hypothetical protein H6713_21395 [Myxococcales bacterium]|nr:hypothetical protein [Myxococcales bacterium]MCB9752518.1 hypothetical protein [Myxococcales bacterium]
MRLHHIAILACCLTACMSDDLDDLDTAEDDVDVELAEKDEVELRADAENQEVASLALVDDEAIDSEGDTHAGGDLEDEDGDEALDEDALAAALDFEYRECVHALDSKRPKLTKETQQRTKDIIAHVHKRMKASRGFRKLLMLVALREASYQSGLVHRLQPDIEGSHSAWRKMKDRYPDNPYAEDPNLWQTYGLFGMNSNYFTMLWSKQADPRVLCDPIVDVLVYRRAAERALRKLNGTIKCKNADGETYDFRTTPTWATIHRAVNGGKLCPSKHENQAAIMRKYFNARAIKKGLDADERVTSKMLGVEPDRGLDGEVWETQEEMVMGLWEEFEALAEES